MSTPAAYRGLTPTFPDPATWTLPAVLRARAASHGDRPYLDVPAEGVRLTYAETLDRAERIVSDVEERMLDGIPAADLAPLLKSCLANLTPRNNSA